MGQLLLDFRFFRRLYSLITENAIQRSYSYSSYWFFHGQSALDQTSFRYVWWSFVLYIQSPWRIHVSILKWNWPQSSCKKTRYQETGNAYFLFNNKLLWKLLSGVSDQIHPLNSVASAYVRSLVRQNISVIDRLRPCIAVYYYSG